MIKAVAFDLDGTIYLGDNIIDGVLEVLDFLNKKSIKILFFTNNSTKTRVEFKEKLQKMGIHTSVECIYSSAYATAKYLKENSYHNVFCLGTSGLQSEIQNAGVSCTNNDTFENISALVVGFDLNFDYKKLTSGLNVLHRNKKCQVILCNRDRFFPVEGGSVMPACGPIAAAVEACAGRNADIVIGKPETYMIEMVCSDWNLKKNEVLIVGDTYESDIAMAIKFGSPSLFINPDGIDCSNTISIDEIKIMRNVEGLFE